MPKKLFIRTQIDWGVVNPALLELADKVAEDTPSWPRDRILDEVNQIIKENTDIHVGQRMPPRSDT